MPVTNYDTLGFGFARVVSPSTILNVNAGSKTAPVNAPLNRGDHQTDMALFGSSAVCAHIEGDSTISMPWNAAIKQQRGPYVHKWDGASLTLMGGNLDPATDGAPAANGDRCLALEPRIASDGTDIFVAYFDNVVTDIGVGSTDTWLRIAHWNGGGWTEVASEKATATRVGLAVQSGKAYAVYPEGAWPCRIRVLRSDGSAGYLPDSGNQYVGYGGIGYCAATNTPSGPVGFYTKVSRSLLVTSLVMFNLDTLTVIAHTQTPAGPSPLTPYIDNSTNAFPRLTGGVTRYGASDLALTCQGQSLLRVALDGLGGFTTIDGTQQSHAFGDVGHIATDSADPAELWFATYGVGSPLAAEPLGQWEEACQSRHIQGTPLNTTPYGVYNQYQVPFTDAFTVANSFFVTSLGQTTVAVVGDHLYVFYCYYPQTISSPGVTQPFWTQFILYDIPIVRGGGVCSAYLTPLFGSRLKGSGE